MNGEEIRKLHTGVETAFINGNVASELSWRPQFLSNDYNHGKKVLSSIEDELQNCDYFQISVTTRII